VALPGDGIYPLAKQGLTGLMRAMAVEYGPFGITSNAIAPGWFATETNAALAADEELMPFVRQRIPTQRWGRPDEIAGAALFLASDAASFVNGHVLTVDGGMSVRL
jgi:gluconate 5-dehydrogenase